MPVTVRDDERRPELIDPTSQLAERAGIFDDVIGPEQALLARGLRSHPIGDVVGIGATSHGPLQPHGFRGVDENSYPSGIDEGGMNGHLHHDGAGSGLLDLGQNQPPDGRMGDRFQRSQLLRVGEYDPGKSGPVDPAIDQAVGPTSSHRGVGSPAALENRVADLVGSNHECPPGGQHAGDSAFPSSDTTAQDKADRLRCIYVGTHEMTVP